MERVGIQDPLLVAVCEIAERALVAPVRVLFLEWAHDGVQKVLRLYIDRPGAGVTVADCAQASDAVGLLLEVEDPIPFAYTLEVSSPGVDRPLASVQDFTESCGKIVRIESSQPIDGRKRFHGKLASANEQEVELQVDGKNFLIPLRVVKKAKLDYFASVEGDGAMKHIG